MIFVEGGNKVVSKEIKNIAALATNYNEKNKDNNCLTVDDIERSNFKFSENILLHAKRFIALGLNKGDKIGILLFNSIEYLELMYGAMYAGLSPVCINARYKTHELDYVLIDLKGIGGHSTRLPAEADMIFIPNFNNKNGEKMIKENKDKIDYFRRDFIRNSSI